jgi:MFS family permease
MIATLRQRNFALLWFGGLISMTGDLVLYIALPYHVYHLTGSVLSTGLMFIAGTLPGVLFGSVAGVFVDRWNRKQTMIIANILQGLCLLSLFLARSVEWLWVVYLVSFVEAVLSQFFSPAEKALLPHLVSEKHLMAANSLNALNNNMAKLIGPPIGAVLFGLWGLTGVVFLDSVSFFAAAVMIAFITWSPDQSKREVSSSKIEGITWDAAAAWKSVWQEWLEGIRLAKSNRMIIALLVPAGIASLGDPILVVLLIPFVSILKGGVLALGWLFIVRGLGGLLGGFIAGKIGDLSRPTLIFPVALGAVGLFGLIMYNIPILHVALVCLFLIGVFFVIFDVSYVTLLQTSLADQFRGRIFGAVGTTLALVTILGQVGASALGDHVGIIPMLNVSGILYVMSGLVAFLMIVWLIPNKVVPKNAQE